MSLERWIPELKRTPLPLYSVGPNKSKVRETVSVSWWDKPQRHVAKKSGREERKGCAHL